jgi:hypothetical protein
MNTIVSYNVYNIWPLKSMISLEEVVMTVRRAHLFVVYDGCLHVAP